MDKRGTDMSREILQQLNCRIRSRRPKLPVDAVCQVFEEKGLLEIGFLSRCCKNDLIGSCIMCDYGCAVSTQEPEKYIAEMKCILENASAPIKCLLLCTNGSFFDESQIPSSLFKAILMLASQYDIPTIEFETHYLDVSSEKLDMIQKILSGKHIMIEMGLEAVDPIYQENVIMKRIDLPAYERTIQMIQQYGFEVETNIMVGLPFLNAREQLQEALDTVTWSFARQCKVVLFPINIKPYTLLMRMYQKGIYSPVSHWLLILLLNSLPVEKLGEVTIAWYGNREEKYNNNASTTVFPSSCPQCRKKLMQFYSDFLDESDYRKRKYLIEQLTATCECACLTDQINLLKRPDMTPFKKRYADYCRILKREYIDKEN